MYCRTGPVEQPPLTKIFSIKELAHLRIMKEGHLAIHTYTHLRGMELRHKSALGLFGRASSESSSKSSTDMSSLFSASSPTSISRPRFSPFIFRVCNSLRSCLPRWIRPTLSPTMSVSTFFFGFACESVEFRN